MKFQAPYIYKQTSKYIYRVCIQVNMLKRFAATDSAATEQNDAKV